MKTTHRSGRFFLPILVAALAIASVLFVQPARGSFIITLQEVGSNVVATGSGTLDLTDLGGLSTLTQTGSFIRPLDGRIILGTAPGMVTDYGGGGISGPLGFGTGGTTLPSSSSGNLVGIFFPAGQFVQVPAGYTFGSALSNTATWNGASFASLGVTPGTYTWTWGTGAHADSFTVRTAVPDTGSTFGLLLLGLVASLGIQRFRGRQLA